MLDRRYQKAVQEVIQCLSGFQGVRPLNNAELLFYNNFFAQGWEIPELCSDSKYKLRVLISSSAPYSPPRIAVWPSPLVLKWPHLEEKGLLCLMDDLHIHSTSDYARVVYSCLGYAQKMIEDSLLEDNFSDFEDEFQTYWERSITKFESSFYTLCKPEGPSRWVSSFHRKTDTLVADDDFILLQWLKNLSKQETHKRITPQKIPLLWLPRPFRPNEYPKNIKMLCTILKKFDVNDNMLRQLLINDYYKHKSILLGFEGRRGSSFAGLYVERRLSSLRKGFRENPPAKIFLMRCDGAKTARVQAVRLDSQWIHGRDHNLQEPILSKKMVIIFGIGSIGSSVVELLVKSGVGEFILVDPDLLNSENVSRHVLGIDSLSKNKAEKLAEYLSAKYPHISFQGYPLTCEEFCKTVLPTIKTPDLIISAMGSWRTEGWLNAQMTDLVFTAPILYGWSEAHAAAGHAVVFFNGQGCLRCTRDEMGRMRLPVTFWPDITILPVPACGGLFQPYGAVEICHIHGVIADLALDLLLGKVKKTTHNVWIGPKKILENTNGQWNAQWIQHYGYPGRGGILKNIEVDPDPKCPECSNCHL